ncbi:DNA-binding response regulator [Ornithinimicrobium sp. W1665]|uniref:helix-turn-helix transcriptional regulator n=1 Tax=Ornithinimicrobium sp. W1665 TaxID=3416666 RepID=UPI003CE93B16
MTVPAPVTVAILNDYEVVVRGVHAMLEPFADRVQVVEVAAGLPVRSPVDVVLYDTFSAPQVDSADFDLAVAAEEFAAVCVYSWDTDPRLVEIALSKGCRGYLDKGLEAEELVTAVERVAAGELVVSPSRSHVVPIGPQAGLAADQDPQDRRVELVPGDWPGRSHGLSPREAEVVALITQGMTNVDIAARAFLSINSVKTYIRSAYRKIGVSRRSQAVRWGMQNGLAPDTLRDTQPDVPQRAGA